MTQAIPWTETGLRLLAWFAGGYALYSLIALRYFPRWFAPCLAVLLAGIGALTAGPPALLALALFILAAIALGRDEDPVLSFLIGSAIICLALYLTIAIPVHSRALYWVLLCAGAAGVWKRGLPQFERPGIVRLFTYAVLAANFLIALKPETGADALAMHLTIPTWVARLGHWPFDVKEFPWAVMPMSADWAYTAVFLPGGEPATRLLNFAFFAAVCLLLTRKSDVAALLFATTPLTQLVTGSLFVENYVAALVLAAWLLIERYRDLRKPRDAHVAAFLLGSACSAKIGAFIFLPLLAYTSWRPALVALAAAAPPYLIAFWKTGNPVFPFANQFFRSPLFDLAPLVDLRYQEKLHWTTLYDLTFHSSRFMESADGAIGFHYLLLPVALFFKTSRRLAAISLVAGAMLIAIQPNLRYIYVLLPLASLAVATIPIRGVVAVAALNFVFWNAASWSHRDFFTGIWSRDAYLPPERQLARQVTEGPVAMFGTAPFADLKVKGYADMWHSRAFYTGVKAAKTPEDVNALVQSLGIRSVIAPKSGVPMLPAREYLRYYVEPLTTIGSWYIGRVRDERHGHEQGALLAGAFEDTDSAIGYSGPWLTDRQFAESTDRSLTYVSTPGSTAEFRFRGTAFTWVFTKASNRGTAIVDLDGETTRVNLYSPSTEWGARMRFASKGPGEHTVRITVEKDFVDIDALIIE